MRSKPQRHRPYGFLKQLPIPERPWNSISMDFIEKLPSSAGFDAILVIVDRMSKQAIFIPTFDTVTSSDLARLFVLHVFSKHGVRGLTHRTLRVHPPCYPPCYPPFTLRVLYLYLTIVLLSFHVHK